MKTILTFGLLLGILVEVWTAIVIASGWHKDPSLLYLFFLVVPIQATLLVLAIRQTAGTGASYARKVMTGGGVSLVGGLVIALGSVLLTTVVFPNYFDDVRQAGEVMLRQAGKNPDEVAALVKANEPMYHPWPNALQGFVGTMVTGLLVSMIASAWIRKR